MCEYLVDGFEDKFNKGSFTSPMALLPGEFSSFPIEIVVPPQQLPESLIIEWWEFLDVPLNHAVHTEHKTVLCWGEHYVI